MPKRFSMPPVWMGALCMCLVGAANLEAAEYAPVGGNVLVNNTVAGPQLVPSIGMGPNGDFVIAWFNITFDASQGIYARRFDAGGTPLGPEFRVSYGSTVDDRPLVAVSQTGAFVIVWKAGQDFGQPADAPGTGRSYGIFGKRYDAAGQELPPAPGTQGAGVGNEFQVNTSIDGRQQNHALAMDASGAFVVIWEDDGGLDGDGIGLFGKRYDALGQEVAPAPGTQGAGSGNEFQVNSFTTGDQTAPHVTMDDAGQFLVTWTSPGQEASQEGVFAKRYDASGQEVAPPAAVQGAGVGNEFQVNAHEPGCQLASIATLHPTDGTSAIAWFSWDQSLNTYAKRYDASGFERAPGANVAGLGTGNEFRVNTYQSSFKVVQSGITTSAGDLILVWTSEGQDVPPPDEGVYAKLYAADGSEVTPLFDQRAGIGNEFQVNDLGTGNQGRARIAAGGTGFAIVWEEFSGRDGDSSGVYVQRYGLDSDADGVADEEDVCPGFDDTIDTEADLRPDGCDNCVTVANTQQANIDGDAAGDVCDVCPADPTDSCNPDGSTAQEIAAASGGSITSTDGALSFDIPAGSMATDATISATQTDTLPSDPPVDVLLTSGSGVGLVVAEYDLQPDGTTFDPPAILTLHADVTGLNATQRGNLSIYVHDPAAHGGSGGYAPDPTSDCTVAEGPAGVYTATCTVAVSHFTRFAVITPNDADGDGVADLFPPAQDNCPLEANPGQEDCDADDIGDLCDADGPAIEIVASRHTVGPGTTPGSSKEPLSGLEVCAYDKSPGSCAQVDCGGVSHQHYECIATTCPAANCCMTDEQGTGLLRLPPGEYVIVSLDATRQVLPDPLGVSAGSLDCGDTTRKYLQQIVKANGNRVPGRTTRLTGSELLIIEPEFVVWDDTEQYYPFVFESIGDWGVTASVVPPEGFVADYEELFAEVADELESVQFTITEVGSTLEPTRTLFDVIHKGQQTTVEGRVDIYLTAEYATARGFDVERLRAEGFIRQPRRTPDKPAARARTPRDR